MAKQADPAAVLNLFFAISASQIDRDIAAGWVDDDLKALRSKKPQTIADELHKSMVRAKIVQSREYLSEDARLYYAYMAANRIAEPAVDVAHQKGRLAELRDQIAATEKREGLKEGEFWSTGEGPEDYQKSSAESDKLLGKIHDTVVSTVFRKYQLGDLADLFDNDRSRFDRLAESGRKSIFEKR